MFRGGVRHSPYQSESLARPGVARPAHGRRRMTCSNQVQQLRSKHGRTVPNRFGKALLSAFRPPGRRRGTWSHRRYRSRRGEPSPGARYPNAIPHVDPVPDPERGIAPNPAKPVLVHPLALAARMLIVEAVMAPVWLAAPRAVAHIPTLRSEAEAGMVVVNTVFDV